MKIEKTQHVSTDSSDTDLKLIFVFLPLGWSLCPETLGVWTVGSLISYLYLKAVSLILLYSEKLDNTANSVRHLMEILIQSPLQCHYCACFCVSGSIGIL